MPDCYCSPFIFLPAFYPGDYRDTLNDAKAALQIQPAYMKALERGNLKFLNMSGYTCFTKPFSDRVFVRSFQSSWGSASVPPPVFLSTDNKTYMHWSMTLYLLPNTSW